MGIAVFAFLVMAGTIFGGYLAVTYLPGIIAARRLDRRLRDVAMPMAEPTETDPEKSVVKQQKAGPLPSVDTAIAGSWLARLIEQSGTNTTASAVSLVSAGDAE